MKQSEIWLIDPDPTKGAEIQKRRPAIINDDRPGKLPLKVIVPVTDRKDHCNIAPRMVKIEPDATNGLSKTSSADCFQIRSLSRERLVRKLGYIDANMLNKIKEAIKKVLGFLCCSAGCSAHKAACRKVYKSFTRIAGSFCPLALLCALCVILSGPSAVKSLW